MITDALDPRPPSRCAARSAHRSRRPRSPSALDDDVDARSTVSHGTQAADPGDEQRDVVGGHGFDELAQAASASTEGARIGGRLRGVAQRQESFAQVLARAARSSPSV